MQNATDTKTTTRRPGALTCPVATRAVSRADATSCRFVLARAAVCTAVVLFHPLAGHALGGPGDPPQAPAALSVPAETEWHLGVFVDGAYAGDFNAPPNHLFRNRGTTPRVDEASMNMAAVYVRKTASGASRWGLEFTGQMGQDSKTFGFSATAPNIRPAEWLTHLGPANASYLFPVGSGLTVQGGIFNSLIGYDSLYAKDNLSYTRPWGADYTPYLMLGINASGPLNEKVTGTVAVVNGYWHLAHANDVPSVAGQIAVKATPRTLFKQTFLYGPHQTNTALEFWRALSDTLVEHKAGRLTTAFEYQLGTESVDAAGHPRALWMAAQMPLRWVVRRPWSVSIRPEFAWDRDGRWIGAPQSVAALTTTVEYRLGLQRAGVIVRLEHRLDRSHGVGGGFFRSIDGRVDARPLTPTQNLMVVAVILTLDASARE
jgi:hypothetical protein